ncbi:helix-turn-helix domain-containing protein [Thermomonospora umbrina]|uniref:Excisionase family DNA binding protein n=1 Tax=Thermomonospora umbrina TaxID=111806 RepID=A0A3D9SYE1_9ACTN|nr:helix-turn-helix domain-containing protein [Thermomonospora umbrina]REE96631.1 excisionase family DNA binding protein [Thermomonospora umbrina]
MQTVTASGESPDKALYRIPDVVEILSLSRTVVYQLVNDGRLRSVKQGRTRLIPASAIAEYVALLEQEAEEAA